MVMVNRNYILKINYFQNDLNELKLKSKIELFKFVPFEVEISQIIFGSVSNILNAKINGRFSHAIAKLKQKNCELSQRVFEYITIKFLWRICDLNHKRCDQIYIIHDKQNLISLQNQYEKFKLQFSNSIKRGLWQNFIIIKAEMVTKGIIRYLLQHKMYILLITKSILMNSKKYLPLILSRHKIHINNKNWEIPSNWRFPARKMGSATDQIHQIHSVKSLSYANYSSTFVNRRQIAFWLINLQQLISINESQAMIYNSKFIKQNQRTNVWEIQLLI
ncbi:Hypothetical_protein [Hexamita inflata]|uniref:Hypothetical_protein n=1 Tax=Hexamita inflata TaxID=28002 RepID=A0AA86P0D0_9EUKA|nr:Hypothetical protein HINF_LOCUS16993 [Hexamita inflata]